MKGIVFTEFMKMVEAKFSADVMDDVIDHSDLSTDGVFTAVGTYPHSDIVKMVVSLSNITEIPVPTLVHTFGKYLFGRFADLYPPFFQGVESVNQFLSNVHDYIHVEVKKLYPDAQLPSIECKALSDDSITLVYRSEREMADLAEGLIEGCCEHFKYDAEICRTEGQDSDGKFTQFIVVKR